MRAMVEMSGLQAGEDAVLEELLKPSSPPLDCPGPCERVAAALKVAALAIGPQALLRIGLALDPFDSDFFTLQVVGTFLWTTILGGSGVVLRWLTLGTSPFVDRAATAPLIATGLAISVEFVVRALRNNDEQAYSGVAIAILCLGILGLYWSVASTFLARDGETTRRRRQWKLRDLAISLALFGLYAAALRWMLTWFDVDGESPALAVLFGAATFAGIFLIPFVIDLASRFAARSRYRWAFAAIGAALSLGIGIWWFVQLGFTFAAYSTPMLVIFGTAIYIPVSALQAGLTEWRPLLAMSERLDERLRSGRLKNDAIRAQDVSLVPSSSSAED